MAETQNSSESSNKVEMLGRLARWKINTIDTSDTFYKKSEPFKMGIWNWYFSIRKDESLFIHLFPEASDQPPFARFLVRYFNAFTSSIFNVSPVEQKLFRTEDDFVWFVNDTLVGPYIVDVEFLDLKINQEETSSIWYDGKVLSIASQSNSILSRMLDEAIHADLTIITADGSLRAHKAVLSASSPVFQSMFNHNLQEKESSTLHIKDMSAESCTAFISLLYGTIKNKDFWKHWIELLKAVDKYDIGVLKDICEENLLEGLKSTNVFDILHHAWIYQLQKLKKGCFAFLFRFGKVHDMKEETDKFMQQADRELMYEMFQELLSVSKPRIV